MKDRLRSQLKEISRRKIAEKQKHVDVYVKYMHEKILNMYRERDEYVAKLRSNTEAWCSYIDTRSEGELKGLSLSHIQGSVINETNN